MDEGPQDWIAFVLSVFVLILLFTLLNSKGLNNSGR